MCGQSVAVDDFTGIADQHRAVQDNLGGVVDLQLHINGGIGLEVLVLGKRDSAPAPVIRRQIDPARQGFEHLASARVLQMVLPE